MKIVCGKEEYFAEKPTAVALGNFDGLHLGHRYLLERMLETADTHTIIPAVCSFTPHPEKYYGTMVPMISTTGQKTELLKEIGVKLFFQALFDLSFATLPPERFMEEYIEKRLNAKAVIVGDDFRFGKDRQGDISSLEEFCKRRGMILLAVPRLEIDGKPISSTTIREAVASGNMEKVPKYLGRYFSCAGTVIHGDETGRKIGFPTANIDPESELLPPDGIYAGYLDRNGVRHAAMIYVGNRPTVTDSGARRLEAHIIEYSGDLYGEYLEIFIVKKMREDRKFGSVDELRAQLERDKTAVLRTIF